jgi:hypothetical protein
LQLSEGREQSRRRIKSTTNQKGSPMDPIKEPVVGPVGNTATSSKTWIVAVAVAVIVGLFILLAR